MIDKKQAMKLTAAAFLALISALAVLVLRQFNPAPLRHAPEFRTLGPKDAEIVIHEFTDFACPACRKGTEYAENILEVYKGRVRLEFKHYPLLMIHPWSLHAAAWADCAGKRGKFWEYAKMLFDNQEKWGYAKEKPAQFAEYARALKLDPAEMGTCADAPDTLAALNLDISEAELRGVNATPTFFVGRKRAVGGPQLLELAKKFDAQLRAEGK